MRKLQQRLTEILKSQIKAMGADTVTYYVHDPVWPHDLNLVVWGGVRHPEPMHGLLRPDEARRIICEGASEIFADDVREEPGLLRHLDDDPLYGGFVQREDLRATARIIRRDDGQIRSSLFVGFRRRVDFEPRLQAQVRALEEKLAGHFDELQASLGKRRTPFLARMVGHLREPFELVRKNSVDQYLDRLLHAAMSTFGVTDENGLGTLYSFDANRQLLQRRACRGVPGDRFAELDVRKRQGIASWVATRRCSILIDDLKESDYARLHQSVLLEAGMRSQIAVPMLAGDELLGVVNLECAEPRKFEPGAVRALWHAANQAAVALWMSVELGRRQELLQIAREAVRPDAGTAGAPLDRIAKFACDTTTADRCDIWQTDEGVVRFEGVGSSDGSEAPGSTPRPGGWTERVTRSKRPVWLESIEFSGEGEPRFDAFEWGSDGWDPVDGSIARETSLHAHPAEPRPRHELGMPLVIGDEPIGAVWLEFDRERVTRPEGHRMEVAESTAGMIGLVLQSRLRTDRRLSEQIDTFRRDLLPDRVDEIPGLDVGLVARPAHGSAIGGDFCAFFKLDGHEDRFGIVIGDGEGHGIEGAMHMLPVFTAFRTFFTDTCAPKYVLDRIAKVAHEIAAFRATVSYHILDVGKRTILGSSLGHPSLIIVRAGSLQTVRLPEVEHSTSGGSGYVSGGPLLEDYARLRDGDLVIGFTDGITEAGPRSGLFGENGILHVVHGKPSWESAQDLADAIYDAATAHNGFALADDATVFVLRIPDPT